MHQIDGKAKAMVVTSSRLYAVRYLFEFRRYIKSKGYTDLDVLVAFSGEIEDDGNSYTEEKINKNKDGELIKESQFKENFHSDNFNMLIVAEKYQTGFDEPYLHTMFVDKKLSGVKAVQTLSRLNRITSGKRSTFVLDFVNTAEDIQESFQPYYEATLLEEETDPNIFYSLKNALDEYQIYNNHEVVAFGKMFFSNEIQGDNDICKLLYENGALCPMAYFVEKGLRKSKSEVSSQWQYTHIRKILSEENYTGDLIQGKTTSYSHKVKKRIPLPREKWDIVKGAHEPIVTHKMFADVQQLLQMKGRKCTNTRAVPSILSGFLICADCGKRMVRNTKTKDGREYKKFCCSTSKKHGQDACLSHYIDEEVVIKVILYCIKNHIEALGDISQVMDKLSAKQKADRAIAYLDKQKRKASIDLGELENLIGELYKDYKTGLFNMSEYHDMKRNFESEKVHAQKRVDSLTKQLYEVENLKITYSEYIKDFVKHKNVSTLTRSMVVSMIDRILVHNEKNIDIVFKYQNVYKKMQSIFENQKVI